MKTGRFATPLTYSLIGLLAVMSCWPSHTLAQDHRTQKLIAQHHEPTPAQRGQTSAFVKTVREATERFRDVSVAEVEGYALMFGCVSGPDWGAMGMHYVNMSLVLDGVLDATKPEIVIYEPLPNGRLRLIGADYLVFADAWHTKNPTGGTPQLGGQLLHLIESPNRYGLDTFYTVHVWAWKENPTGMFVNWHSKVSCEAFSGQ
jgi:hypothetical protein